MADCCDNFDMLEDQSDSFETWQGLRGPYYTPSVDSEGNLSWTNNGGLPNPPTVNITGPNGPQGEPTQVDDALSETSENPVQNKVITEAIYGLYPTDTASGAVASITDGADGIPVKALAVGIEPVQAGSGDPSPGNVRPISGWDVVSIVRTGSNLLPPFAGDYTSTSKGITVTFSPENVSITGTSTSTNADSGNMPLESPIRLLAGQTYVFGINGAWSTPVLRLFLRNASNDNLWYGDSTTCTWTVTPSTDINVHRIMFRVRSASSVFDVSGAFYCNLNELGAYEPYKGNADTIQLGQTVYGGTLDVKTGVLTVDRAMISFGAGNYHDIAIYASNTRVAFRCRLDLSSDGLIVNNLCDRALVNASGASTAADAERITCRVGVSSNRIYWYIFTPPSVASTVAEIQAWFDENPLNYVYVLNEPIEYQLTPQEVTTLLGVNNIWSDAGDVSVTYRADIGLYIQKLLGGNAASLQATALKTGAVAAHLPADDERSVSGLLETDE